nr:MAG TPA: hypothetical protein [Bacteriophage sp.]
MCFTLSRLHISLRGLTERSLVCLINVYRFRHHLRSFYVCKRCAGF